MRALPNKCNLQDKTTHDASRKPSGSFKIRSSYPKPRAKEIRFAHVNVGVALSVASTNSKVDRTFNKSLALGGSPSSQPAGNERRRLITLTPTAFCALSEFMEVMTGGDD